MTVAFEDEGSLWDYEQVLFQKIPYAPIFVLVPGPDHTPAPTLSEH